MAAKNFKRYTKAEHAFIKKNLNLKTNAEIGEALGRSGSSISYQLVKLGLRREGRKIWTNKEITEMRRLAPKLSHKELAAHFSVSIESAKAAITNHKIKTGRTGFFPKGHRPWNFRTKGLVKSTLSMQKTQFKKGEEPPNTLHDGAITIRLDHPKDRRGRPYKWIRISKGKWIHYHRWLWEQKHGAVPKGHVIIFKDENTMNCKLSNLKMITMRENLARNYDREKCGRAAKELSDNYIAGKLAKGDKKLRKAIILGAPELIKAKREQLKLKRLIHERDNETRKVDR